MRICDRKRVSGIKLPENAAGHKAVTENARRARNIAYDERAAAFEFSDERAGIIIAFDGAGDSDILKRARSAFFVEIAEKADIVFVRPRDVEI